MRMSYDNTHLFTVGGKDGCIFILEIRDRDPKTVKRTFMNFSEEILTEKQEIADFEQKKQSLTQDLENEKNQQSNEVEEKMVTNGQEEKTKELTLKLSNDQLQNNNNYQHAYQLIEENQDNFKKSLAVQEEQQ